MNSMQKLLSGLTAFGIALAAFAAPKPEIEPDRKSRLYQCGEEAEFTIKITGDDKQPLKEGKVFVIFSNDNLAQLGRESFDLATAEQPIKVKRTMNEPGFLRASLMLDSQGKKDYKIAVVGFDPEKIEPGAPEPDDFMAFWENSRNAFRAKAGRVEFTPEPKGSTDLADVRRVTVSTPSGRVIHGFLATPKLGFDRYPLVVNVPGAGPGNGPDTLLAATGFAVLTMNVHPYQHSLDDKERKKQYETYIADGKYQYRNITDRDAYFFKEFYLGADSAIDAAAQLPEIDADRIGVFGSSQGGGSAIILAGLNQRIKGAVANVPALCDHNGHLKGRESGWPHFFKNVPAKDKEAATQNARYFDAVNFAKHVKCPVHVIVGFLDPVCRPSSVYAMYHSLNVPKKMITEPLMLHETWPSYNREKAWLFDLLWPNRVPNVPPSIEAKVGDLGVRFDGRSFWSLYRVDYKGDRLGVDQWGSHYGNVFAFYGYGFVGTGHKENENERLLSFKLEIDGQEQPIPAAKYDAKSLKLTRRSMVRGLEVISTIQIENNAITESVEVVCRSYERLSSAYLAMYPWVTSFREYKVLDPADGGGERFTDSGKFLLDKPVRTVALYHPGLKKGVVSTVLEEQNLGKRREQYRDTPNRYRKHYTQTLIARRMQLGERCKFTIITAPFEAEEADWADKAQARAKELETK